MDLAAISLFTPEVKKPPTTLSNQLFNRKKAMINDNGIKITRKPLFFQKMIIFIQFN